MRLRPNRHDSGGEIIDVADAAPGRRPPRRGWGPFSGGQLTLIIVTFAVLLMLPVGAWALSSTNVSIIDRGGVNKAVVTSAGRVAVQTGLPGAPFTKEGTGQVTVPSGKTLTVETISLNTDVTHGNDMIVSVHYTTGGQQADLFIPPVFAFTESGYDTYEETIPVLFYADSGTHITVVVGSDTGTTGTSFLTVAGHLNT